jgi:hypothetical protein
VNTEEMLASYYERLKDPRLERSEFEEVIYRIKVLRILLR